MVALENSRFGHEINLDKIVLVAPSVIPNLVGTTRIRLPFVSSDSIVC